MNFFNNFCLSEEMKDMCIAIAIIHNQIIRKIIIWWWESSKYWCKSEKTLVEWFWWVLVRVKFTDPHRISKPDTNKVHKMQMEIWSCDSKDNFSKGIMLIFGGSHHIVVEILNHTIANLFIMQFMQFIKYLYFETG